MKWKNVNYNGRTVQVTKFEFYIKGHNDKDIFAIITALEKLNVGNIHVDYGHLKYNESVNFVGDRSYIMKNNDEELIGIQGTGHESYIYSGKYVSKVKRGRKN